MFFMTQLPQVYDDDEVIKCPEKDKHSQHEHSKQKKYVQSGNMYYKKKSIDFVKKNWEMVLRIQEKIENAKETNQ